MWPHASIGVSLHEHRREPARISAWGLRQYTYKKTRITLVRDPRPVLPALIQRRFYIILSQLASYDFLFILIPVHRTSFQISTGTHMGGHRFLECRVDVTARSLTLADAFQPFADM